MERLVDVTVREGKLRGKIHTNSTFNFLGFRGIPYAKPPIGKLRFKDPVPAEPWSDIRDATKLGNAPLHYDLLLEHPRGNEDCLYLNVYTKGHRIDLQAKRAVMVWIHGDNFHFGSNNNDLYGPDYIIRNDVVLVTINYRLGVFGFLNVGNEMAWGNQGLKDALMALRWVHDNISNFGGDPENVTIFGQGFGGSMVHFLATCSQAAGLFHKAISQSGTAATTWAFSLTNLDKCVRLIKKLGGKPENMKKAVKFLKSIHAKRILRASKDIITTKEKRQLIVPFVASYDYGSPNPFFVENPVIILRRGVRMPFIIGFTISEGSVFVGGIDKEALDQVNSDYASVIHPSISPTLSERSITTEDVRHRYFGNGPVSMETIQSYNNFIGDMHFHRGIFDTATIQIQIGHRSTYMYQFTYDSKCSFLKKMLNVNFPGTTYGEELFYLFCPRMSNHTKYLLGLASLTLEPVQNRIIDQITQMWTDFAKTGNPTPAVTTTMPIKWTPLERKDEYPCLIIDEQLRMEITKKKNLRFFGVF